MKIADEGLWLHDHKIGIAGRRDLTFFKFLHFCAFFLYKPLILEKYMPMEKRFYFIAGDLLACAGVGAVAGWSTAFLVPIGWPGPIGMLAGMAIGMIVGMFGGLLFSPFFGAMELMLPVALTGMTSGMFAGMAQTMSGLTPWQGAADGAAAGFLCLAFTYLMQFILNGEAAQP